MSKTILKCIGVGKSYNDGALNVQVLNHLDFEVAEAESVSIIGSSGSGKSTLLHLLGGLDMPSEGKVMLMDQDLGGLSQKQLGELRNRYLGFVYQFHHLLPEFSALENVMMPALINKNLDKKEIKKRALELLTLVGLSERIKHKPLELSGGEKQRVAIARSMINNPEIILADEPTGNLDTETSLVINNLFKKINEEKKQSIIIVTHSLELANLAEYKYKIEKGEFNKVL